MTKLGDVAVVRPANAEDAKAGKVTATAQQFMEADGVVGCLEDDDPVAHITLTGHFVPTRPRFKVGQEVVINFTDSGERFECVVESVDEYAGTATLRPKKP